MISTDRQKIRTQDIVEYQLPSWVREDFPLVASFFGSYYTSQEAVGAPVDLIKNLTEYVSPQIIDSTIESTILKGNIDSFDTTITTDFNLSKNIQGTSGFPDRYGLIQIDDEIILYERKNRNQFLGCVRGFSGTTSYKTPTQPDELTFKTSEADGHKSGSTIINLSSLLINEFFIKLKYLYTPGFEERNLNDQLNKRLFVSRAIDFYSSKGSQESFDILFGALYGEWVKVFKPRKHLFRPSDAKYRLTSDLVAKIVSIPEGVSPYDVLNKTIRQKEYIDYSIPAAASPITNVERSVYDGEEYFTISLDSDYDKSISVTGATFGTFSVHPNTKTTTETILSNNFIDVDSTIGFPNSGELSVTYTDGTIGIVSYASKTSTQFNKLENLSGNVNAFSNVRLNVSATVDLPEGTVEYRIGSVLSKDVIETPNWYFNEGDYGLIESLGISSDGIKSEGWFYNQVTEIELESFDGVNARTYIPNNLILEDLISIKDPTGSTFTGIVNEISDEYSFTISFNGPSSPKIDPDFQYILYASILKPLVSDKNKEEYSYIENFQANVQNTYGDFNGDVLVNSSSLPSFFNTKLNFYDRKIPLNGTYGGETFTVPDSVADHGYFTGESVYYKTFFFEATDSLGNTLIDDNGDPILLESKLDGLNEGVYFIKRVDARRFKLAASPPNLYQDQYISVSGTVENNSLTYIDFYNKDIENQNLLREIKPPVNKGEIFETEAGTTGILVNGVEILNYKSQDIINFGKIEEIVVTSPGSDYDVINPPLLDIRDDNGKNANGIVAVAGSMVQLDLLENGFDYVKDPVITIKGGNGKGALGEINTELIDYFATFNPVSGINTISNTIGFSTFHKYREIEHVIYRTDDQAPVSGIVTNARYFAKPIDAFTIELYKNKEDLRLGINTISIDGSGEGTEHNFESVEKKRIVYSIGVSSTGYDYENKERRLSPVGVSTASHVIKIKDHQYNDKDIIKYSNIGTEIQGLSTSTPYIVTKINEDEFKLSSQGIGTGAEYQNYFDKKYIEFKSVGVGTHIFNYEPITVKIEGEIGVATFSGHGEEDFNAKVQPLFRGEITSVFVEDHGQQYGTDSIINYERQPIFETKSGEEGGLLPIANNGQIVEVLVTFPGSGYNSPPKLVVNGSGKYAELVPIIKDGELLGAKIKNPGIGYFGTVTIDVIPSGLNAEFFAEIQEWTINLFQKNLPIIGDDDGVLTPSRNPDYGIEYSCLYAPRKLREIVFQKQSNGEIRYGNSDLIKSNNKETESKFHSPIIGWAYDGNPIYGPYGFNTPEGGIIRPMKSGYQRDNDVVNSINRPILDPGSFVEDFVFTGDGDLDVHNGRYCITPDYPNGVYAYFATIDLGPVQTSGPFFNYKEPQFPYLIGHTYKSLPNAFNYDKESNVNDYDLNNSEWFRNTTPYFLNEEYAVYPALFQPHKFVDSKLQIKNVSTGNLYDYEVPVPGSNYKIGDKIKFEQQEDARDASARVSSIVGKDVSNISVATSAINNIEVVPFPGSGKYVAFAENPHNYDNLDRVFVSGFNTSVNYIQDYHTINVNPNKFTLNTGIGSIANTGIVTYLDVYGTLSDGIYTIRENDVIGIGTEKFKILNVDTLNSRFKVLRAYDGTVGINSFTSGFIINEFPRKFEFNSKVEDNVEFKYNREYYFDPVETVAIGQTSGVGIGTTLFFANPGAGITQKFVPTRTLWIPGHEIETGEELIYNSNGGTPISIAPTVGAASTPLQSPSLVYGVKISSDLVGLAPNPIGIDSTGSIVGIASTATGLLYFTGLGTSNYHSIKTNRDSVVGEVSKNTASVETNIPHGLAIGDEIQIDVESGLSTTVFVSYNDYNNRIVLNKQSFVAAAVSTTDNTIELPNHGFLGGEKVIYQADLSSTGPDNNGIYYVFRHTKDRIKLSPTRYDAETFGGEILEINSASNGSISPINPPIDLYRNQRVTFDLSDSSLSFLLQTSRFPLFDFSLYSDINFRNKYQLTEKNPFFEVRTTGQVGVTPDASLTLTLNDNVQDILFYKLDQTYRSLDEEYEAEVFIDTEVVNYNKVSVVESLYSGNHTVAGITSNSTFTYNLERTPEIPSYTSGVTYTTNSRTAEGPISEISFNYFGSRYSQIVGVSSITSENGSGALITPNSENIGSISRTRTSNIGIDYPTDNTLRPIINLPEIIELDPLNSIVSIFVTSQGTQYTSAPDLVVIDGITGEVKPEVELDYELGDIEVEIIENTNSLSSANPIIIPINNSNGIGVTDAVFNPSTREVTVSLRVGFSDADRFPFKVGSKILVENIAILGFGNTASTGYNSEDYDYALFEVTGSDPQIGGSGGRVTYSMANVLESGETPGIYDPVNSTGQIVPQSWFPTFVVELSPNDFFIDENITISNSDCRGTVQSWIPETQIIKVSSDCNFREGEVIIGSSSGAQGKIKSILEFDAEFKLGPTAQVLKGWITEAGFLNLDTERIQDGFYYQKLSYSLKSKVYYQDWDDAVSSLNHTAGFIKFSDLQIESGGSDGNGGSPGSGGGNGDGDGGGPGPIIPPPIIDPPDTEIIVDIIQDGISLNCYTQWDLVTENEYYIGSRKTSNEIYFKTKEIRSYFESIGNRVLTIDDFSSQFNSDPRGDTSSVVERFSPSRKFNKILTYVVDTADIYDRQLQWFTVLHDEVVSYTQSYGQLFTKRELGTFDFITNEERSSVIFYPIYFERNNYVVSMINISVDSGITTTGKTESIGDIVNITSYQNKGINSSGLIFSLPESEIRAMKLHIQIDALNENRYEAFEMNLIHDGTDAYLTGYNELITVPASGPDYSGIGTFDAFISGGNLNLTFTLDSVKYIEADVNILAYEFSNTGITSGSYYIGADNLNVGALETTYTTISASATPSPTVVSAYSNTRDTPVERYSAAHFVLLAEDTTNSEYVMEEMLVLDNSRRSQDTYMLEYGSVDTNSGVPYNGIGTFFSRVNGGFTELVFTPEPNINVKTRVLQMPIQIPDDFNELGLSSNLDLENAIIDSDFGSYEGTFNDIKRSFDLTHKGDPIFQVPFDGTSRDVLNLAENSILVDNHFFVTGERVIASYDSNSVGPISIAPTNIAGLGVTTKLYSGAEVFVVSINSQKLQLAATVEDALAKNPVVIDFVDVGIGKSGDFHTLTSIKQNTKCLIAIDNMIQSPITPTKITTEVTDFVDLSDVNIRFSGFTSIFSNDLLRIGDEIVKVNGILSIGATDVRVNVNRRWLGTEIDTHDAGTEAVKIEGNYNIVENTINFASAPIGPIPIGSITNPPDERDWTGITTFSTFQGRTFIRSAEPRGTVDVEAYDTNCIFDDISDKFNGITSSFTLESEDQDIVGFSTNNGIILINSIFQEPTKPQFVKRQYDLEEDNGQTEIQFYGDPIQQPNDIRTSDYPSGGTLSFVGSTTSFGYQPLIGAGATAVVDGNGTITSINITNPGSGYRPGIQTNIFVGVTTDWTMERTVETIGYATANNGQITGIAVTNPGIGYTTPLYVVIDDPIPYYNLPLIYSSDSTPGVGTEGTVDIQVSLGSSVMDFQINRPGYDYGNDEILTVAIGGTTGIPTTGSSDFIEFQIPVEKTERDEFSGWHLGRLADLDKIEQLFDGVRRTFPLKLLGEPVTIKAGEGSNIDVNSVILVFINDILQRPSESYVLSNGSAITFAEPPRGSAGEEPGITGDSCKLLFYQGSGDIDVIRKDVACNIEIGDSLTIHRTKYYCPNPAAVTQDPRLVRDILSVDIVETLPYQGLGISGDPSCLRVVEWCKQTEDIFLDGQIESKSRCELEARVYPTARAIHKIGSATTAIYLDSVKLGFDDNKEEPEAGFGLDIKIVDQTQDPPVVEKNTVDTYLGDFGRVVGYGMQDFGGIEEITVDLFIPPGSYMRDPVRLGINATSISRLSPGDFFVISDSNVGFAETTNISVGIDTNIVIGVGTQYIDNVYQVMDTQIVNVDVPGIGVTPVLRVGTSIRDEAGITFASANVKFDDSNIGFGSGSKSSSLSTVGFSTSHYFGSYSWGKILLSDRQRGKEFDYDVTNRMNAPIISRTRALKDNNYL